jgi:hypothetical protein
MKNLIITLIFLISLISCNSSNPTQNDTNPFADSTNIKFIYERNENIEVWQKGSSIGGNIHLIDFNNNYKNFIIKCGEKPYIDYSYQLLFTKKIDNKIIDSLDKIFLNYNFNDFKSNLPYDIDSNIRIFDLFGTEIIKWKYKKNDYMINVKITTPFPKKGSYKLPENYYDFRKAFDAIIDTLKVR